LKRYFRSEADEIDFILRVGPYERYHYANAPPKKLDPLKKCPYCKFKSDYQEALDHHITYTRVRGHPSPPNVWASTMTEDDHAHWEDFVRRINWDDIVRRQKRRRSG